MKKSKVTKVVVCLLVTAMLVLVGCGSGSAPDNPNIGLYVAKSAEMSGIKMGVEDIFEGGFTVELKNKGKATATFDDESGNLKWTLEGDKFHAEGDGAVLEGTLKDGEMVLENILDSGVTLTLVCDEIAAKAGQEDEKSERMAERERRREGTKTENAKEDADSIYGRYEAVSATDSEGEYWIEEGEYLIVNDDDTVSMYVAEQNLDFDTTIENNKFYLNKDTKVGEINDDGSITLNLSDEVKYTFAKKGSELFNEWSQVAGKDSVAQDTTDFGVVDVTAGSGKETAEADYDFDEALKLVGDYEGFIVFKKGANCYGRSFDGITADAYSRIVIDENKKPFVYVRHIYGESINIEHVKGEFREDGWLTLKGMMGTDDGPVEWMGILSPPVGNEPMLLNAVLTSDYETPLFDFYMKPLGAKWDYSYVDEVISEKDFNAYVNNMAASDTGMLEDDLQLMQDFWSKNAKMDDPIKMITDELPDPKLLKLYKK